MPENNLQRMIKMAQEVFDTRSDPNQISVTQSDIAKLQQLHPATMTEMRNHDGPIAWMLLIPTTIELMEKFISNQINEQELLDNTPLDIKYDSIYLCSAMVLEEHRGKGLAKKLLIDAIKKIMTQHHIQSLFFWSFTGAGEALAESVSNELGLPVYKRDDK